MGLSNKQKQHLVRQANKWLQFKLKVESPFKKELKSYFFQQYKIVSRGGQLETIAPVLDKHYKRIVREITGIKIKQEEEDDDYGLEDAILLLLLGRAVTQAQYIDKTTQKKLQLSIEMARQTLADDGIVFPPQKMLNKVSANIFKNLNSSRSSGIATFETQSLTEKIHDMKQIVASDMMNDAIVNNDIELARRASDVSESMTLENVVDNFDDLSASELFASMDIMEKSWVTMGDSKVRPWHQKANWQTVPVNEPFTVNGEFLMYPGDSSLGASLDNISGCRCHASYL